MAINDLHSLLLHELRDLHSAESQLINGIPKMINLASDEELRAALKDHFEVTKVQFQRLEEISGLLGFAIDGHTCKGMQGILTEANETLKETLDPATRDAAIIAAAQKVEHYEISGYGTAAQFAREMDHKEVCDLLEETLREEGEADKKLSSLAKGGFFTPGLNDEAITE